MSDTVQIPEAPIEYSNEEASAWKCGYESGYELSQQKLKSFRKKLENITIGELLKNPKIVLELFDKEFGLTLP